MIIPRAQLLSSNAIYYPCFDPAYPDSRWQTDFRVLPLLFDYIVVPSSHILENRYALSIMRELRCLYRNRICIGSLRIGQGSIQEFFFAKLNELGDRLEPQHEHELLEHASNYQTLFHRDTASQSAAFRVEFVRALERVEREPEAEKLISQLPIHGIHVLHRETLDELIEDIKSKPVRRQVDVARCNAYFAAGATGNMSFLYDPQNQMKTLRATYMPREALIFLTCLFERAGFRLADIEKVPLERIVQLSHRMECRLFRHLLISTINQAHADYSEWIFQIKSADHVRQRRFNIGWFTANLCVASIGLINLSAGIASLILGNIVLGGTRKLVDFFCRLSEPLLGMQNRIEELLYEYTSGQRSWS